MASGHSLIIFDSHHAANPASSFGRFGERGTQPFIALAEGESCYFAGIMPQHYAGTTGIGVYVHWMSEDQTSGTVVWDIQFAVYVQAGSDMDTGDGDFAAVNAITDTAVADAGDIMLADVRTFTDGADMDSVTAGDFFRMKIARNASGTMANDAQIVAIEIRET